MPLKDLRRTPRSAGAHADTCPALRSAPVSAAHLYSRCAPQPLDVQLRPSACLCAVLHRKHRRARRQDGCQADGERTAACPQIRPCSAAQLWVALQRLCVRSTHMSETRTAAAMATKQEPRLLSEVYQQFRLRPRNEHARTHGKCGVPPVGHVAQVLERRPGRDKCKKRRSVCRDGVRSWARTCLPAVCARAPRGPGASGAALRCSPRLARLRSVSRRATPCSAACAARSRLRLRRQVASPAPSASSRAHSIAH